MHWELNSSALNVSAGALKHPDISLALERQRQARSIYSKFQGSQARGKREIQKIATEILTFDH